MEVMSHPAQRVFVESVKDRYPSFFKGQKVLEVGSLNINGTVRDFFEDSEEYIGIDVGPGPGVDVVAQGQEFDYPDNYFDISISAECFEHNPYWKETFLNMIRMTRPDGLVVFTCATLFRPEHGTSRSNPNDSPLTQELEWNYYRNLTHEDFKREIELEDYFSDYDFQYDFTAYDLYFQGRVV